MSCLMESSEAVHPEPEPFVLALLLETLPQPGAEKAATAARPRSITDLINL